MKLQYQMSDGNWCNCDGTGFSTNYGFIKTEESDRDRTEEFLVRCDQINQMSREDVIKTLSSGKTLRNDSADWYSNCRDLEAVERIRAERIANQKPVKMIKCSCGHTIPETSCMSASMGTSCPDCYDDMSA